MPTNYRVFISCVSAEFKCYRETLRKELTNSWREVKVQEDFSVSGSTLLEKLDDYIQHCQALIHLIGEDCGHKPQAAEVRGLLTRHSDFTKEFPELAAGLYDYSYTQWEAYLAIYHNVRCFNYIADTQSKREYNWTAKSEQQQAQREHQKRLEALGRDRYTLSFDDARDVALRFLNAIEPPKDLPHSEVIVEISHLPEPTTALIGRQKELRQLTERFTDGKTRLAIIVAAGGIGKSALTDEWLREIGKPEHNYYGKTRVFGWSFYSQGSHNTFTNSQPFFHAVLPFLGIAEIPKDDIEKARLLARECQKQPCLLILDGLEPLQYAKNLPSMNGELQDSALKEFILQFRRVAGQSFVLLSSRQPLVELKKWQEEQFLSLPLATLPHNDGAKLLAKLGVQGNDTERQAISQDLNGHALSLVLTGHLLMEHHAGDPRYAKELPPLTSPPHGDSDVEKDSRHALRVLDYYDSLQDAASRCFLQLLGLFDRPMQREEKRELIAKADHALPLRALTDVEWKKLEQRLENTGLLLGKKGSFGSLEWDTHPIIRAYFGEKFKNDFPESFKQAHLVLFDFYQKLPEKELPHTEKEMLSLYQAVVHGCLAEQYQKAFDDVYCRRILEGRNLHEENSRHLIVLLIFFPQGLSYPVITKGLQELDQAWVSINTSIFLKKLGRLSEGFLALETALRVSEKYKGKLVEWRYSLYGVGLDKIGILVDSAKILSQLLLPLGRLGEALVSGKALIKYAETADTMALFSSSWKNDEWIDWRMENSIDAHKLLASVLHYLGQLNQANQHFLQAEKYHEKDEFNYHYYYSISGVEYYSFLLDTASNHRVLRKVLKEVIYWLNRSHDTIYLLILARTYLALDKTRKSAEHYELAMYGIQKEKDLSIIPPFYLYRADFYLTQNQLEQAAADLNSAWEIIERCGMKLYQVDYLLIHGRFSLAIQDFDTALNHYEEAKNLIQETGYHLRDAELDLLAAQICQQTKQELNAKNAEYYLQNSKNRIVEIGQWGLMPRWEMISSIVNSF